METIKEKKKAEYETIGQLMKGLRDKGWIPRGYNEVIHTVYDKSHKTIGLYKEGKKFLELVYKKSLRELCAKESGLWQFVCENRMVKEQKEEKLIEIYDNLRGRTETVYDDEEYQYRLIESSLKDESELEDFLLSNIKVEGGEQRHS